jgi:hypothetical protein
LVFCTSGGPLTHVAPCAAGSLGGLIYAPACCVLCTWVLPVWRRALCFTSTVRMKATGSSKIEVPVYLSTWHHITEDRNLIPTAVRILNLIFILIYT